MADAVARLKLEGDTGNGPYYDAHCGRCGQHITGVSRDDDGNWTASFLGWRKHDDGVWFQSTYQQTRRQEHRRAGESAKSGTQDVRSPHLRDLNVEQDKMLDPNSPKAQYAPWGGVGAAGSQRRLPLRAKCPRCPAINEIAIT